MSAGRLHPNPNVCWLVSSQLRVGHEPSTGPVDPVDNDWMRRVAGADRGAVSCPYMHLLVELHGQSGWGAALTPLSVTP
jgi:hypothetical protein